MSRGSDSAKVSEWRERFERFKKSDVKLDEFCVSEGVTKANFYSWRRKLGLSRPRQRGVARRGAFQQVVIGGSASALIARLPGNLSIEVGGANESVLRVVVNELVRASKAVEGEPLSC